MARTFLFLPTNTITSDYIIHSVPIILAMSPPPSIVYWSFTRVRWSQDRRLGCPCATHELRKRISIYLNLPRSLDFYTINCFLPYCTYFSLLFFSSLFNQEQRLWLGPWWVELFSQHFFRWRLTERLLARS